MPRARHPSMVIPAASPINRLWRLAKLSWEDVAKQATLTLGESSRLGEENQCGLIAEAWMSTSHPRLTMSKKVSASSACCLEKVVRSKTPCGMSFTTRPFFRKRSQ